MRIKTKSKLKFLKVCHAQHSKKGFRYVYEIEVSQPLGISMFLGSMLWLQIAQKASVPMFIMMMTGLFLSLTWRMK